MRPSVESVCFGGIEARRLNSASFCIREAAFSPNNRLSTHSHQYPTLTLAWEGGFTESNSNVSVECSPKSVLFKSSEQPHSDHAGPTGARCLMVEILRPAFDQEAGIQLPAGLIGMVGSEVLMLRSLILREFLCRDAASSLALEGLVWELLAVYARGLERSSRGRPIWFGKALALLHDGFQEPLSLQDLADAVSIHPLHLARSFRLQVGCSVGSYHRRLRLDYAARQLRVSQDSLCKIALAAGFFDQAHFSRQFKKHTGLTPSQFRANAPPRSA